MQVMHVSAPETFPLKNAAVINSGVEAGDYVTLVYLPGTLAASLQLYGWLGLNPDLELIQKNGRPLNPRSTKTAMAVVFVMTALAGRCWLLCT